MTVKLPLPPLDNEEFPEDDMVVMVNNGDGWALLEQSLKFTKSSVMFDVKELHRWVKYSMGHCGHFEKVFIYITSFAYMSFVVHYPSML